MDNATGTNRAATAPQTCTARAGGGAFNRRTLYIGLSIGAAAGLFLGWDWLVAIGAASVIIAFAPCLVMCALGLCAMRIGQNKNNVPAEADATKSNAPRVRTAADEAATNPTVSRFVVGSEASAEEPAAAPSTKAPQRPPAAL